MSAGVDKSNVLLDEERRLAAHQEVKAAIDGDVNARLKREMESDPIEVRQSQHVRPAHADVPTISPTSLK